GWPDAFVAFVAAHQDGHVTVPRDFGERGWKGPLTMRLTDLAVREVLRLTPLSVSADRLGHVAMRCTCLLALHAQQGHAAGRDGSGITTEVYPAASLKVWGLPYRGFKRPGDTRDLELLIDGLLESAPWLDLATRSRCAGAATTRQTRWWLPSPPGQLSGISPSAPARHRKQPRPAPEAGSRSRSRAQD
ncbi:MAG TPA: hypothetical protein VMV17_16870, partial [Streptosporangiaceae bacterium]|nr:hypothetical protein [Streptosporangiaceae bacterium]